MPKLSDAIFEGALFGIFCSVIGWLVIKVHDQDEEIREMNSLLEDFEENISQCEEKLSQLEK